MDSHTFQQVADFLDLIAFGFLAGMGPVTMPLLTPEGDLDS